MTTDDGMLPILLPLPSRLDLMRAPLPTAWDGERVTWDPLTEQPLIFLCARGRRNPPKPVACERCKTTESAWHSVGTRHPRPGATMPVEEARKTRSGRTYLVVVEGPAWPLRDLVAYRCVGCGLDTVYDDRAGESWVLGPEDYGPGGSVAPS